MCYVTVTYYVTLTISLLIKYMSCKQTFLGMCYVICYVTPTMTSLSHTWLRGQLGDGTPHPDDAENNGENSTRSRGRRNKTSCMPDEYGVTTRRIADRDASHERCISFHPPMVKPTDDNWTLTDCQQTRNRGARWSVLRIQTDK